MPIPFNVDFHLFIESLTKALEAKDSYTGGHSDRVAEYSSLIATKAGLDHQEITQIHVASHLHDIGKIGVPDLILLKKGPLTTAEFKKIQEHTLIGYDILKDVTGLNEISRMVLHHHERFDGNGYPEGLRGENIPLGSRIIAIADTYDALTTNRPYRTFKSHFKAMSIIGSVSGTQLDPDLILVFEQLMVEKVGI